MAFQRRNLKTKRHLFILKAPMVWQNFMLIGLQLIIENHTKCLHVMEYFLIMKVQEEEKLFVTRKITMGLNAIDQNIQKVLYMGNLDSLRDWGHVKDYVEIQWKILQQEEPDDFVIATGRQESVRKFIELSAKALGWEGILWEGKGLEEVGRRKDNGNIVIRVDPKYFRPSEVNSLLGDPTKAIKKLGWKPKYSLEELVSEMIDSDKEIVAKQAFLSKRRFIND